MENAEFKKCSKCNTEKCSVTGFPKNSTKRGGFDTRCKDCRNLATKAYSSNPKNKERIQASKNKWKKNNPDKVKAMLNKWRNNQYKTNPEYKLVQLVRSRILEVCNTKCVLKTKKSMKYLGCTAREFKAHIEKQFQPGMTWENHTNFGWHVDHIIPIASFDLTDPNEQVKAFHYTNLQPLWWDENLKKGKKIRNKNA